jgi:hypothetical protein
MRFFDVGGEATGVIAVGQFATGFVAVGQVATGVIAVGQVARGFVAIGQGAIGLVAVGMGAVGVFYAIGILGIGGRGLGLVLPVVPRLFDMRELPSTVTVASLQSDPAGSGWLESGLQAGADGTWVAQADGCRLPVKLDSRVRAAVLGLAAGPRRPRTLLHVSRRADAWVVDRIMALPEARFKEGKWWGIWATQLCVLIAVVVLFWLVAGFPSIEGVLAAVLG